MKPLHEWRLETEHIGRRVVYYPQVDSTNAIALALARDTCNEGVAVLAGEQTAGRGRHGRSWSCPAGEGVLLSALVFPPAEWRKPAILTAWAAVAVAETVRQTAGLEPTIKWPNDVLIDRRKVCGILIEQAGGTVVGIGLNVNQSAAAFADPELGRAGSLASCTGRQFDVYQVSRALIQQLDAWYACLLGGRCEQLEDAWRNGLGLLGKRVVVECLEGVVEGTLSALGLDEIELERATGARVRMAPERIRHITRPAESRAPDPPLHFPGECG